MQCPNCNSWNIKHAGIHFRCQQCHHSWYISRESLKMPIYRAPVYIPRRNTGIFYCQNHQGKANAYVKALEVAGYTATDKPEDALFMLTDSDISGRLGQIYRFHRHSKGGRVFLYPHTATPMWLWDGIYVPSPFVSAVFGIGEGGAKVPMLYGYDKPIHPVGWTYTRIRKFKAKKRPRKVLFAPIHANGNGYLSPEQLDTNARAFSRLLGLVRSDQIDLTVRYLHKLEWNGIERVQGVKYVQGKPDQSVAEINAADVVVSKQNMQYMSVARGVPTVGMDEDLPPMTATSLKNTYKVVSWERYRDYMKFPIDIFESDNTMEILCNAAACDERIATWREQFIGKPFDASKFVEILEGYL